MDGLNQRQAHREMKTHDKKPTIEWSNAAVSHRRMREWQL